MKKDYLLTKQASNEGRYTVIRKIMAIVKWRNWIAPKEEKYGILKISRKSWKKKLRYSKKMFMENVSETGMTDYRLWVDAIH
jgi:hypothetical protein